MKQNKRVYVVLISSIIISLCHAQSGCLDNSWHLKKKYDNKELHYATAADGGYCKCNCDYWMAKQGTLPGNRCPKCGHYHIPKKMIIVENAYAEYKKSTAKHQEREYIPQKKKLYPPERGCAKRKRGKERRCCRCINYPCNCYKKDRTATSPTPIKTGCAKRKRGKNRTYCKCIDYKFCGN